MPLSSRKRLTPPRSTPMAVHQVEKTSVPIHSNCGKSRMLKPYPQLSKTPTPASSSGSRVPLSHISSPNTTSLTPSPTPQPQKSTSRTNGSFSKPRDRVPIMVKQAGTFDSGFLKLFSPAPSRNPSSLLPFPPHVKVQPIPPGKATIGTKAL